MGEFLQSIILSDFMMFLLVGVMMILITSWAYSRREIAGYLLGWLIGLLIVIIISVFSIGNTTDDFSAVAQVDIFRDPAVMVGLLFSSTLGVGMGFLIMSLARSGYETQSRVRRSLTIALATSFTLTSGYLLIITARPFRLIIAVLVLGLAIGALLSFVLGQQRPRTGEVVVQTTTTTTVPADEFDALAQPADPVLSTQDLPSPLGQRIHNLRQKVRRQGPAPW
jgi:hypothetical protein